MAYVICSDETPVGMVMYHDCAAMALYQSFGFVETDRDGNEIIMEMAL